MAQRALVDLERAAHEQRKVEFLRGARPGRSPHTHEHGRISRDAFKDRGDGFLAVDFHVSGPYDSPKTDLAQGLLKNAAKDQIQQRLFKLLK